MAAATHLPAGPDTVCAAFEVAAEQHADRSFISVPLATAQAYGIAADDLSYGQARATIERITDAYRRAGYGHGHRIGVLLENRPEFFVRHRPGHSRTTEEQSEGPRTRARLAMKGDRP
jgi:hypothetical protein